MRWYSSVLLSHALVFLNDFFVHFINSAGRGFGLIVGVDVGSHCAQASGYSRRTTFNIGFMAWLHFFSVL
jgi:hypothetical protein